MKKWKILLPCLVATSSMPFIGLVGCAKKDKFSETTKMFLEEFSGSDFANVKGGEVKGLNAIPRPSKWHIPVIKYLTERVRTIMDDQNYVIHNDALNPEDPQEDETFSPINLWFDIPASDDGKDIPGVILQGHTDMIVAGLSEEEAKVKPIVPEIEKTDKGYVLHSKDHKTSIGADDGAGLSLCLMALRNRDKFTHGPIRFLFTSDEDVGLLGANKLNTDVLTEKNYHYLLNIDDENIGEIGIGCSGGRKFEYNFKPDTDEDPLQSTYELNIGNLKGGHGGMDISKGGGRANADRIAFEFLSDYLKYNPSASFQIARYDHYDEETGKDVKFDSNQLVNHGRLIIKTNQDANILSSFVTTQMRPKWKEWYPDEDWKNVITEFVTPKGEYTRFIKKEQTKNIITILGSNHELQHGETSDGLIYGEIKEGDHVIRSNNVAPVNFKFDESGDPSKDEFNFAGVCRSLYLAELESMEQHYQDIATNYGFEMKKIFAFPSWHTEVETNPTIQLLIDAYKNQDIQPNLAISASGVEPGYWDKKAQDAEYELNSSMIGPQIDGAHSQGETLHLDGIDTVYNVLIYYLSNVGSI